MADESAIIEETNEEEIETIQDEPIEETPESIYDIDEPDDEFEVPVIESLDDEDEKTKSEDKQEDKEDKKQEKPAKEETPDDKDKISESTIKEAKELGMNDEHIAKFGSEKVLKAAIDLAKSYAAPKQEETKQDQKPEVKTSDEEFSVKLDPDIYDPEICNAVNETAKQINEIKNALQGVNAAIQMYSQESFTRSFDSLVNSAGQDYAELLGSGSIEQIDVESDFYTNRCKVIDEMQAIAAGYAQSGKGNFSQKQLFERAVNGLFKADLKKQARKEISDKLSHREGQFISRPTSTKSNRTLSAELRATNAVKEKLKEFGAYNEDALEDF